MAVMAPAANTPPTVPSTAAAVVIVSDDSRIKLVMACCMYTNHTILHDNNRIVFNYLSIMYYDIVLTDVSVSIEDVVTSTSGFDISQLTLAILFSLQL